MKHFKSRRKRWYLLEESTIDSDRPEVWYTSTRPGDLRNLGGLRALGSSKSRSPILALTMLTLEVFPDGFPEGIVFNPLRKRRSILTRRFREKKFTEGSTE